MPKRTTTLYARHVTGSNTGRRLPWKPSVSWSWLLASSRRLKPPRVRLSAAAAVVGRRWGDSRMAATRMGSSRRVLVAIGAKLVDVLVV